MIIMDAAKEDTRMSDATRVHRLTLPTSFLAQLDAFIRFPDQRPGDILYRQDIQASSRLSLQWVVRHDIFEGTVAQLSLIDDEAGRYLAGEDRPLKEAGDVWGSYAVRTGEEEYRVDVTPEP
jgi:hypothetical protein